MIIVKDNNKTKYYCSICGHKHVAYNDGTSEGEPFQEYERKLVSHKFWEEDTTMGRRSVPHEFQYTGYICPKCNKLQVTEEDAKDMNDHGDCRKAYY